MEVQLSFKSKAQYSKFMRNFRNSKGTVISNKNVSLSMNGEGFGDMIKGVGKQIGKKVLNEVVKEGAKQIKKNVISKAPAGLDVIGNTLVDLASNETQKKVSGMGMMVAPLGYIDGRKSIPRPELWKKKGSGFLDTAKSLSKSKLANNLGKMAIAEGKKQLKQQLNKRTSGLANAVGNVLLNEAGNQATGQLNAYSGGGGYTDSLGGNGIQQSMQNITGSNAKKVKKAVGGSFRLP